MMGEQPADTVAVGDPGRESPAAELAVFTSEPSVATRVPNAL